MNSLLARRTLQLTSRRFKFSYDYKEMVDKNKCVVFMKGTPQQPQVNFIMILLVFGKLISVVSREL